MISTGCTSSGMEGQIPQWCTWAKETCLHVSERTVVIPRSSSSQSTICMLLGVGYRLIRAMGWNPIWLTNGIPELAETILRHPQSRSMLLGIDRLSATVHIGSMDAGVCVGPDSRKQSPTCCSVPRATDRDVVVALRLGLPDSPAPACAVRPTADPQSCRSGPRPPRAPASEGCADSADLAFVLVRGPGSRSLAIFVTTTNLELDMRPALMPTQIRATHMGGDLTRLQGGEVLSGPTDFLARARSRYRASSRERRRLSPVARPEAVHPDSASRRSASRHAC